MKMMVKELATIVGATNDYSLWADLVVEHVEFDTRKVTSNTLFVPLQGGARDGHDFIETALESGAVMSLWSEKVPCPTDCPVLVVSDTLEAFQKIARFYLEKVKPKVIGITGSNGKTTTKDMIEVVLSQTYKTYKTQGNYNNHIGLPYTILHMPETTEMLVLEMGMNHFGEIEVLSRLAQPDVAAITMIGESHIEFLGSRLGIAQAKMEITSGLKADGLLIIPGDEPLLAGLVTPLQQKVTRFGNGVGNQLVPKIIEESKSGTCFQVECFGQQQFTIPVIGQYNVANSLIALGIGNYFQIPVSKMAAGLAQLNLTQSRTEWLKASNGAEILSDVYNANPTAMALVIDTFSQLQTTSVKRVVLADMGELGQQSASLHLEMAAHLNPEVIEEVYLYGPQMRVVYDALEGVFPQGKRHHFGMTEKTALINLLKNNLQAEDMVLLKGSNSMKLIEIVEKLIEN